MNQVNRLTLADYDQGNTGCSHAQTFISVYKLLNTNNKTFWHSSLNY